MAGMDPMIVLKGLALGFSIAAPVGPIGVLCIRRTLSDGRLAGLVSGLGAATADAFYGTVAGFGLTAVSAVLVEQHFWLKIVGGAFLCYLGIRTLLSKPAEEAAQAANRRGLVGAYLSTFLLTLTNPMTILSFVAIFAGMGIANTGGDYGAALSLVVGVFLGSALWWLTLSGGVGFLREVFSAPASLRWINRVSGVIITGFGVYALLSAWALT
jgi:threonine/homoserine/homoserine lactone efflux protein